METTQLGKILVNLNPYHQREEFLKKCNHIAHTISVEEQVKITDFARYGNQEGFIIINNLEMDNDLPKFSCSRDFVLKNSFKSETWLGVYGSLLGDPFSYIQEGEGFLFHNIIPQKKLKCEQVSLSSENLLELHTEVAFSPFNIDHVLLLCLRGDKTHQAKTLLSSIRNILPDIPYKMKMELHKSNYLSGIDYSFGISSNEPKKVSVLYGDPEDPLMVYDRDLFRGVDLKAQNVLNEFDKIVHRHIRAIELHPGELLIIDNRRAIHGRTPFQANFDGFDRWVQRLFTSRDLNQASKIFGKKERIISYKF